MAQAIVNQQENNFKEPKGQNSKGYKKNCKLLKIITFKNSIADSIVHCLTLISNTECQGFNIKLEQLRSKTLKISKKKYVYNIGEKL